jgi:beta-galactosidase/beta-glucuronidase
VKNTIFTVVTLLMFSSLYASDPEMLVDLRGQWRFNLGDNAKWSEMTFDDSRWEQIFVPSRWENEGFGGYDGFAWYRKTFTLKDVSNADSYFFDLGYIDDADQVFVNGQMIGQSGAFPPKFRTAYDSHRNYQVPSGLLKSGNNVIAVRVYDATLDGGIMKGRQGLYVKRKSVSAVLNLEGLWKFQSGDDDEWRAPEYNDRDWKNVAVPGYWESYKIFGFEVRAEIMREAWYRKTFVLPQNLRSVSELVVVLGKIDDFDEVYLNGHLIGRTNDNQYIGKSNSYNQFRIYVLLDKYLNRNGVNTLAVKVTDIGFDAGIYQGPVAIVPIADYKTLIREY